MKLLKPRSRFYDGAIFARFVDPMMDKLHRRVAGRIGDGLRVLDACCGTGNLAFKLAERSTEVVGVELSPKMVEWAESRRKELGHSHLQFLLGDVSRLDWPDRRFDVATISMALHEMSPVNRRAALRELARVADEVIVLDFAVPMPWNTTGLNNRLLEIGAGPEHFFNFLHYYRNAGMAGLALQAGLTVTNQHRLGRDCFICTTLTHWKQ